MYITARSYLLAGFTAASIVATIPSAPRTTVHLPDIHAADIRLAAAESEIAAVTVPVSVVGPVAGNFAALAFDLAGTQAALMNSLSFVADFTIANITGGTAENLPPGFGVPQRVNVLTADLNNLSGAINRLTGFLQSGSGGNGAGTQSGVNTGSAAASNSGTVTAVATGAAGLSALGPLIGDVAILGVDMTASQFAMTQTVTRALAAASTDLGAGHVQAALTDFTTILGTGLTETQTRIADDRNNVGAALARLVGWPSATTGKLGTANSVTGAASALATTKTTSTPAVQSHRTNLGPGPVVTKPTSSTPTTVHVSTTSGAVASVAPSTVSPKGSPHTPGTTATPTRQGNDTTATTKPATTKPGTPSPTKAGGQSPTKAGDSVNGTSTPKHSAPAKPHKDGAKHRKH